MKYLILKLLANTLLAILVAEFFFYSASCSYIYCGLLFVASFILIALASKIENDKPEFLKNFQKQYKLLATIIHFVSMVIYSILIMFLYLK